MRFAQKIKISFLDFIKNGKFDCIELGQTKEWILSNFPDPEDFSADCNIWRYGNIEFHFNKANKLFMIFSDYLHELDGGNRLDLDKWIFADYSKLNLLYVLKRLNQQDIDYCKSSDHLGIKLTTKCGVTLGFAKDPDEVVLDSNQLHMSFFALMVNG